VKWVKIQTDAAGNLVSTEPVGKWIITDD